MKRFLIILLFVISSTSIILTYQNCSDAKLTLANKTKIQSSLGINGLVCPMLGPTFGNPTKIIFVEDMSLSNLGGGRIQGEQTSGGGTVWDFYLGVGTVTDGDALRLKVADDIIDLTSSYQNFSYATMGFGNAIMFGSISDSCVGPFINDPALAHQSIDGLRVIHNSDKALGNYFGSQSPIPPWQMGNTSYTSAVNCLKDKIMTDISQLGSSNQRPNYQVFFITDGKPTDENTNFIQTLQTLAQQVTLNNTTLRFNPVYYGSGDPADEAAARSILDTMAQAVDPSVRTFISNQFGAITAELITRFQTSASVSYKLKTFSAVNLTTTFNSGTPASDSDIDGLSDNFEAAKPGLSATNARSSGILDRLCYDRTNGTSCPTQGLTCNPLLQKFLMLNECDIEYLFNNSTKPFSPGLDSDKDNIVDYVEIIRGLNPLLSNAQSDDDGDEISNIAEVNQGTDPLMNNIIQPPQPSQFVSVQISESSQTTNLCSTQGTHWNWEMNNIPLVNTQAYTDQSTGGLFNFSHEKDENVILVTFTAEALNSTYQPKLVYAAVIKLKLNSSIKNITLKQSDFQLVGAVK